MAQAVSISGSSQTLATFPVRYTGFSLRETTGATGAVVRLWDNTSAAGTILEEIALAAGESAREFYSPVGIEGATGLFVQIVSGTVVGSVRIGT